MFSEPRLPILLAVLVPALFLAAGCARNEPAPAPAIPASAANSVASVGGATLRASAIALERLDPAVAARYGLDRGENGALLLVTLRDAEGNALPAGDLRLGATATVLPDSPRPLPLTPLVVEGMTDYIGVVPARAPASLQFHVTAIRGGGRAELAARLELYPR